MAERSSVAVAPPPSPPPPSPPRVVRRGRWVPWVAGAMGVLVLAVLMAGAFVRVPYVIVSPGSATPLDDGVLRVEGATTHPHEGNLLFLTVAVSNRDPNLFRYLFARLDGDVDVQRRESVIGCAEYDESAQLAREQMEQSQDVAKTVALRRLGYTAAELPSRVLVIDVACDGPARGNLLLGDVIVAVDGTTVASADQIRPLVVAHQPGETAVFSVQRDGTHVDVPVKLSSCREPPVEQGAPPGPRFTCAGVSTQDDQRHSQPVAVEIDTARVSGPSAGLAFALAIVDDLTPGELTGRGDVAVTGAIRDDGLVGDVGGVRQKAVTARRAGARLMLVPAAEAREARAGAGDMKVVGVKTFDGALRALERAGGASLPSIAGSGTAAQ